VKNLSTTSLENKLVAISEKINLAHSNIEINDIVEGFVVELLDAEFCSLWFYNDKDMLLLRERGGASLRTLSLEEKTGIIYKCFMTQEARIYNYLASEKDYVSALDNPDNIKIKSKIIFPLIAKNTFVGIITAYASIKKAKKFTRNDLDILEAIAPYLIDTLCTMHKCKDVEQSPKKDQGVSLVLQNMEALEELNQSGESSEEKLKSMANFIHDIRTPANTLQGFLELLEDQISDKRVKEYLVNAKESAAYINQLTTAMLDRISHSKEREQSKIEEIDAAQFFANIAEMFSSNMYEKQVSFNVYIDPLLPKRIEVDTLKLKRVIMNLISNAYKFTPYKKSIEFTVKYDESKESAVIYVRDKGIGISDEKQTEIFEAFKQANETTNLEYGGTGLGLYICADYVKQLGGKLQVESKINKGSTFFFTMPLNITEKKPTFKPDNIDKNLKVSLLISPKNSFSLLNIARYLVRMGLDKNNILAVSSVSEIPEDTTHLIVYQEKFDTKVEEIIPKFTKTLIVEERLFSINDDETSSQYEVISQYGYLANELFKFVNSKKIVKVLIVDDDNTSILLLERILENEYCEVEVARNGKIALEMIIDSHKKQNPYNIIYIDNNMPVMSGLEVMAHVREFERDNQLLPIYAVSTSGDMLDLKTDGKNFDKYVGKPFRINEIRKVLYR
jgi:signal transduction histidine kinase/ActR/RegA family two-component response regulator